MDVRRLALLSLMLAVCAGCGASAPSATPAAVASERTPSASTPAPNAVPTIDPQSVTQPALTCGERDRLFPPEALQGPGLGELGTDAAADVLRTVIAQEGVPASGWHRVIDRPDGVTFVAMGDAETPWWVVTVGVLGGTLQATGYGQCHLSIAPPVGVTLAQWWLDPASPPVTPESTAISILLRERACASGRAPEGRVLPPTIVPSTDSIVIAIGVQERPGGQDCPGNPAFPFVVALPEAIGSRGLFDASEFPPRAVTTADPQ
jgi:hypothetical protein